MEALDIVAANDSPAGFHEPTLLTGRRPFHIISRRCPTTRACLWAMPLLFASGVGCNPGIFQAPNLYSDPIFLLCDFTKSHSV